MLGTTPVYAKNTLHACFSTHCLHTWHEESPLPHSGIIFRFSNGKFQFIFVFVFIFSIPSLEFTFVGFSFKILLHCRLPHACYASRSLCQIQSFLLTTARWCVTTMPWHRMYVPTFSFWLPAIILNNWIRFVSAHINIHVHVHVEWWWYLFVDSSYNWKCFIISSGLKEICWRRRYKYLKVFPWGVC